MCSGERLCRLSVRMSLYAENDLSTSSEVIGQYLNALTKLLGISSGRFTSSALKYLCTAFKYYIINVPVAVYTMLHMSVVP